MLPHEHLKGLKGVLGGGAFLEAVDLGREKLILLEHAMTPQSCSGCFTIVKGEDGSKVEMICPGWKCYSQG